MHENWAERWREITGTDPSWMPRILAVLQRDHQAAWESAISTAVHENAAELAGRRDA